MRKYDDMQFMSSIEKYSLVVFFFYLVLHWIKVNEKISKITHTHIERSHWGNNEYHRVFSIKIKNVMNENKWMKNKLKWSKKSLNLSLNEMWEYCFSVFQCDIFAFFIILYFYIIYALRFTSFSFVPFLAMVPFIIKYNFFLTFKYNTLSLNELKPNSFIFHSNLFFLKKITQF